MYELMNIPPHTGCQNCGECCGVIPVLREITGMTGIEESFKAVRLLCLKVYDNEIDGLTVQLDYKTKVTAKNKKGNLVMERTDTFRRTREV